MGCIYMLQVNYLGYWTDAGAFYYYNTIPGENYETTMLNIYDQSSQTENKNKNFLRFSKFSQNFLELSRIFQNLVELSRILQGFLGFSRISQDFRLVTLFPTKIPHHFAPGITTRGSTTNVTTTVAIHTNIPSRTGPLWPIFFQMTRILLIKGLYRREG